MPSSSEPHVDVTFDAAAPVPDTVSEEAIASLAVHVLAAEGASGDWEIGIRFVDDPTMQRAHVEFMGIDEPTDIMTFPYEDEGFALPGDEAAAQGGDLLISVDRADDHAAHVGWTTGEELLFLVCHGLLHLLGWDDATDEDRAAMLDRQAALMRDWRSAG